MDELQFDDIPFRGIVEQSLAGVYVILDGRFVYVNETMASMHGYERAEFIGQRHLDMVTADSLEEVRKNLQLRMTGEVPSIRSRITAPHRDGHVIHLELHGSQVLCMGRPALAGIAIDISEQVRREEELSNSRMRLLELARHINSVREQERARLARDVHDVLGGMLTSVKLDVSRIVRRSSAQGLAAIHAIATDLVDLVQETIDTARKISEDMRPVLLDSLGLAAALKEALEHFGRRHGITVEISIEGSEVHFASARATQCYRIVQEALTNIARHADASRVTLGLSYQEPTFVMRVEDDGRGLDPETARQGSIGLFSMAERAREIGGSLEIGAAAGGGTSIVLRVPIVSPEGSSHD